MSDWDVVSVAPAAPQQSANPWDVQSQDQQIQGPWRLPAMVASNAAKGASSLLSIPGDIQTGMNSVFDKTIGPYVDKFLPKLTPQQQAKLQALNNRHGILNSSVVNSAGQSLGLFNRPDLQPENKTEQYIASGAQGMGSALPFAFGGGLPALAKGAVGGFGAGLGAQGGHDIGEQYGHPALGSFVGALGGGLAGNSLFDLGSKAVNAVSGAQSPMLQAYEQAGVTPRLAGDVTGNPTLQRIQAFAAKAPFGGKVNDAAHETVNEFGNAVENTANQLGQSSSLQEAGTQLQGESKNWLQNFRSQSQQNWNAVDQFIPPNTPVDVTKYSKALSDVSDTLKNAPETAKLLQTPLSRNLLEALKSDAPAGQLPWGDVKNIRTRIGEMLSDPNLPADTSTTELKRLYSGLSSDMQNTAAQAGPQAQQAFTAASEATKQGHDFIDNVLRPLIKEGQTPEGAASFVLGKGKSGGTILGQIRQEMPDAADELGAYKLRDMALANKGGQNAAQNAISPTTFLSDYSDLSSEAKSALFSDPAARSRIDALAKVADSIRQTAKLVNTSNTATHMGTQEMLDVFKNSVIGGLAGHELAGVKGAIAGATMPALEPMAGKVAGSLSGTPWLTRFLAAPRASVPLTQPMLWGSIAGSLPAQDRRQLLQ